VSSANLMNMLSWLSGLRSAAVTAYAVGPILEPCMMLAMMLLVRETSSMNTVLCMRMTAKKSTSQLYNRRRQVEFSQLGQQRGVSNGIKRLQRVQ